ncbi:MAG: DNA translocase FtsK [bacterium]|nr:DNA translocase FtsK [bacterium]
MARKKKNNKRNGGGFNVKIPDTAKSKIAGILMFVLALIFAFAFFQKAGSAGALLFDFSVLLVGKVVFLIPLFLVISGLVFFGMRYWGWWQVMLALLLLFVGAGGIVGTLARFREREITEAAGWLGFVVSWPVFSAFGLWVGEIVFAALVAVSGIIFWQLLDHEKIQESSFAQGAKEKMRKIFEPRFDVQALEPEPKSQDLRIEEEEEVASSATRRGGGKGVKEQEGGFQTLPLAGSYTFPPSSILEAESGVPNAGDIKIYSAIIKKTLANFDIPVEISEVNIGPAVTQYAFKPAEGIKLARITTLSNDLALALAAHPIRIEAPIPGRSLVGIEIPNKIRSTVRLRTLIENSRFKNSLDPLLMSLGKDVAGNPIFTDLHRMPHLLVSGATGTGKTIALSNIILSLIYRNPPSNLRFILVDPKRVEFPVYNDLPHLLTPVILDTQRTLNALKWLVKEMERRFQVLAAARTRDIANYHALKEQEQVASLAPRQGDGNGKKKGELKLESMPYIVLIIDELADLMASRGKDIEALVVRLAQMARAVGIHLVLATQRPSVEVITGLIKANITARIAFQVASQVDSRTILDVAGAEKLLGRGDMLFISSDFSRPKRIQGAYVSDKDVKRVVEWIQKNTKDFVREEIAEDELSQQVADSIASMDVGGKDEDSLYDEAKRVVVEAKKASASLLQRRLKVGYARAARLLDILEERGVIGPGEGAKPREVYGVPKGEDSETSDWFSP